MVSISYLYFNKSEKILVINDYEVVFNNYIENNENNIMIMLILNYLHISSK